MDDVTVLSMLYECGRWTHPGHGFARVKPVIHWVRCPMSMGVRISPVPASPLQVGGTTREKPGIQPEVTEIVIHL